MIDEETIRSDERLRWAHEFEKTANWHREDADRANWDYQRAVAQGFDLAASRLREAS